MRLDRDRPMRLGVALALALSACASTETGNPPVQPETGLDATQIQFIVLPNMGDPVLLSGGADPLLSAGGTLRITAVDTALDPVVVPIGVAPASFSAMLPVGFEGWLRLQVLPVAGLPLAPLDVLTSGAALGAVERLEGPLADCLTVERVVALGVDQRASVRIASECPGTLSFGAPAPRLGLVEVSPPGAFELAEGRRVTLDVTPLAPFGSGDEDLLILREAGGERRAVTVTP